MMERDKSKLRVFFFFSRAREEFSYFRDELNEIHLWDIFIVEIHFSGAFFLTDDYCYYTREGGRGL